MQITVGIGLLGCGTVGEEVAVRLLEDRSHIESQSMVRYDLRAIAVSDADKSRAACLRPELFTTNARAVVDDPHVDLVVECIGGCGQSAELVERALDQRRHVVTANKDLLAAQGPRLQALASSRGVSLRYEAAVGGAIPIIRSVNEGLAGDDIRGIAGVFNGTCTSILSAMERGADFQEALEHAQQLGYAENDPTGDISGRDSAHKLAVMAQRAFRLAVLSTRIRYDGIASITSDDVLRARDLGFRIRLIAAVVRTPSGILADVAPLLIAQSHAFANVFGVDNVARIVARDAGEIELRGAGAGGAATASAVIGDIVSVLRSIVERGPLARDSPGRALDRVFDVGPFFDRLRFNPALPNFPVWDDDLLYPSLLRRATHSAPSTVPA